MTRVLVVDDEPLLRRAVAMNLTGRGFEVTTAGDGRTALDLVVADRPDAVVLDLGLPDMDGTAVVVAAHRARPDLPIVVLSARSASHDKVQALELGAVDYLTKPFDVGELVARLRSALRRSTPAAVSSTHRIGEVTVDVDAHSAVRDDGEWVHLTRTERLVLEVLVASPGRLVGTRELLTAVRGDPDHSESSYLRIFVAQLRRKLEPDPSRPVHLLTESGMGHRFRP
ncbi:response regulator transcription factor [Jatrophihabitans sp. YIM 134969]